MEILVLHPGGLGDIILSLPALSLLRSKYPAARITIAGNLDHLSPVASGYADSVVSLSTLPLHHLYTDGPLPEAQVHFWRSYDLIVSWTGSGDAEFARKFREIHPNARLGAWRPGPGRKKHVSQLFVDSLEIGNPPEAKPAHAPIRLDSQIKGEGRRWLIERGWNEQDALVALHPGAGSTAKRWPLARFVDLARHLAFRQNRKLLIIEGPAEPGLAEQMASAVINVIVVKAAPLNRLAAVLWHCLAFVGNDSGIAHLAAALQIPSIVLFGPTLPQYWAPVGSHVHVLRDPRGCEGCASGGTNHTCLQNITVEEVIRNLVFCA